MNYDHRYTYAWQIQLGFSNWLATQLINLELACLDCLDICVWELGLAIVIVFGQVTIWMMCMQGGA